MANSGDLANRSLQRWTVADAQDLDPVASPASRCREQIRGHPRQCVISRLRQYPDCDPEPDERMTRVVDAIPGFPVSSYKDGHDLFPNRDKAPNEKERGAWDLRPPSPRSCSWGGAKSMTETKEGGVCHTLEETKRKKRDERKIVWFHGVDGAKFLFGDLDRLVRFGGQAPSTMASGWHGMAPPSLELPSIGEARRALYLRSGVSGPTGRAESFLVRAA
jgi:hypothetical protein